MIAQNINIKLEAMHYEAFRAFALRSRAKTSTENLKCLIEMLPEYRNLESIRATMVSSVEDKSKKPVGDCR